MTQVKNIYQKLLVIQQQINGLGKDKKSNNYSYVTGDKLLGFVKPLMNEQGLLLKQEILSIENTRQDYKTGIGTNYEKEKSEILSKVLMRFTWVDVETGEKDENLFGANGQNDWEKGLGSALTYAERYFLLKYFHIATDEDDIDNPDRGAKPTATPQATPKVTPQQTPKDLGSGGTKKPNDALAGKQTTVTNGSALQPSKEFDTKEETIDPKVKALELFKGLDQAKLIKHLVQVEKLRSYTTAEDFVKGESIEKIREVYGNLTAK